MNLVPLSIKDAERFLKAHKRHYKKDSFPIFALGLSDGKLRGAVIVGATGGTGAELAHIYADGVSEGYTLLYGAAWRSAKALGYKKMIL